MSGGQRAALVLAAVVVAVVAFVIAQSGGEDGGDATTAREPAAERTAPSASAKPRVTRILVRAGKPVGGVKSIAAKKGDTVRFTVSSPDTEDEVHLHGYDLMRDLAPGRPVSFRFEADIEGVFEAELEGRKEQIAKLVVEPS